MTPDREYQARLLAATVLEGDRPSRDNMSYAFEAIHPTVSVELRGMVQALRREFTLLGPQMAEKVKAVCEEKLANVDIDKMIAETVEREYQGALLRINETARQVIQRWLESRLHGAIDQHRERIEAWASSAVYDAVDRSRKAVL